MPQKNLHYLECYFRPLFYRYLYTIIISFSSENVYQRGSWHDWNSKNSLDFRPSHYLQASAEQQSSVLQS